MFLKFLEALNVLEIFKNISEIFRSSEFFWKILEALIFLKLLEALNVLEIFRSVECFKNF